MENTLTNPQAPEASNGGLRDEAPATPNPRESESGSTPNNYCVRESESTDAAAESAPDNCARVSGSTDAAAESTPNSASRQESESVTSEASASAQMQATVSFAELLAAVSEAHRRGLTEGLALARDDANANANDADNATKATTPAEATPTPADERTFAPMPHDNARPDATPTFLSNLRPGFWD